jgi:3'-phosphoadenosine 5'-phosphosulfate sulfotransferase (PAPS reductase)/FAD synthetase
MKIIVSFSGGKDSHACLIEAANKYGAGRIEAVFCDTGWEHPDTYKHITDTCTAMGVKLTKLKSNFNMVTLAEHKKRFPSTNARFCTTELKMKPMIDYVLSLEDSCIIIQGIRADESVARSKMEEECMYFKSYFQPNQKGRKVNYRKRDVLSWCSQFDASVSRPIFNWTAQQVIDCILDAGQMPAPLYYRGFSRVGCFPCIMARHSEIREIIKDEWAINRLIEAEKKIGRSFFPPDYIPKYACKNGQFPMIQDVIKYLSDKQIPDMFEPEGGYSCMSMFHGLCE